ncbi:ATP-binding cassette domain-containing protein [Bacillus chungangensis]|uniref:ABC-type oligopeptide transport system ATPase subunit n=1 Tax=Bacillus chungangensis TaxID=587633 RepID=A0ABT9WNX3_9BACI|nr:ABC transporter ATP-binding protein [Bacillus chungangensis]MDQ0174886.1 ABC-type oligopeptide transport system ATPase subunit [Bacillus chungangensis]
MLMEVHDLKKYYRKNLLFFRKDKALVKAIDGVHFFIKENEIVGLVGESGCGKSTLSRLLVKLEKATAGSITFQGENILQLRKEEWKRCRKECQIIFQDSLSALNPSMRIRDILSEPLNNHYRLTKEEKRSRITEMTASLKLNRKVLDKFPKSLSGGELQRVNICRALLLEPKLLICDEIVSSLDVSIEASILALLKRLNRELNMAILFISHDIRAVSYLCDRVLVMKKGKIVEVIDNKNPLYKVNHPYTKKLFSSLPINHPSKRE